MDVSKMVFVFGSNEAGIHGAGAAKFALMNKGAIWNVGFGHQGRSFAIPTKNWQIGQLNDKAIEFYINRFIAYAWWNPNINFQVTALGTGLAGHTDRCIADMFKAASANCYFDTKWKEFLPADFEYWGTF